MTPMSGALDWLAVGDVAEERTADGLAILGGGAARLTAHAAALGIRTALVAKLGEDDAGRHARDALERLKVELQWLRMASGMRTTVWHHADGRTPDRRVDRGADLALRLDELPPLSVSAVLTVVSGYSLSVEPARSAALGALTTARARHGHSALLLEADLLWWTNARMTRRILEPALAAADSVALQAADAQALFGPVESREALRLIVEMGPRLSTSRSPTVACSSVMPVGSMRARPTACLGTDMPVLPPSGSGSRRKRRRERPRSIRCAMRSRCGGPALPASRMRRRPRLAG
jgi:sugar/nucleoside kinase (ribokinase family)